MTIEEMRTLLGLDPSVSDADVAAAYVAYLEAHNEADTAGDYASFIAIFPEFATVSEETWSFWNAQAVRRVGENYGDERAFATMLLTAHLLSTNGRGGGAMASISASGATSFRSGTFSATISDAVAVQRAKGGYASTSYGQQFSEIQRRLFGGPRLIGFVGTPC